MRRLPAACRLAGVLVASALAAGCDDYFLVCPAPDEAALAALPALLSDTGLYADIADEVLADGVLAYRPAFELWSDGAEKRRWLWLPPGTQIDTRVMDEWRFPVGTRVWKEFRRDGVRVETRIIQRIGPGDDGWAALAYVWQDDGRDARATPTGYVDAGGTPHDVPGAGECIACHGGRRSRLLGVSAVQLSRGADDGEVDLADLVALDLLTAPPADEIEVPGDPTERAALGYLHANCGHCHNQARPPGGAAPCFDPANELDFWLQVDRLATPADTPTYSSAIGYVIAPGQPSLSRLIDRASSRTVFYRMPPLGSEETDDDTLAILRRWIAEMR
jgi:hypothetical protein